MSCASCGNWQQTRSDLLPLNLLRQKVGEDLANSNSLLARTGNFVSLTSPAFINPSMPYPYVTIVPYYNNLVSAVVPQTTVDSNTGPLLAQTETGNAGAAWYSPGSNVYSGQQAQGRSNMPNPWVQSYDATECGCCSHPYTPLPQQGAYVLRDTLERIQAPVEALLRPNCRRHYSRGGVF